MPTETQIRQAELLAHLAVLGGQANAQDEVKREGTTFVLPERMTYVEGAQFLMKKHEEDETPVEFNRTFPYRPFDGARAAGRVFRSIFGGVVQRNTILQQATNVTVNISATETEQVPWGPVEVPLMPGAIITLGQTRDPDRGILFHCSVNAPRKYRHSIEGLFSLVEAELATDSIYRGKAVAGDMTFLDLSNVDPSRVMYSESVMAQLRANVWSMLEHTDRMRELRIALKRSVLLHGPYGTGKTLAAYLTAKIATENGWSFHYARPAVDDLAAVMQTALLYQPAVVFFEDVDTLADPTDTTADSVSRMLDVFDGITNKGTELLCMMTTNHVDRIHKGMLRPGRLDAVIEIGALDEAGVRLLCEDVIPARCRADLNYRAIAAATDGFMPAFVKEAVERSMRYAIAAGHDRIETDDVIRSAEGLRAQHDMMLAADEHRVGRDSLSDALASVVEPIVRQHTTVTVGAVVDSRDHVAAVVDSAAADVNDATKRIANHTYHDDPNTGDTVSHWTDT